MIFEYLKLNINISDEEFNKIYPQGIRPLATRHWTPIAIAKQAAEFLTTKPGTKILDIGSGSGKFCMVGGAYTKGFFTGVEVRKQFYEAAQRLLERYRLNNVKFIQSNITKIDFSEYDTFYFFNSFHENIDSSAVIDHTVETGIYLYNIYTNYVHEQLAKKNIGTRLVTYHGQVSEVPSSYKLVRADYDNKLNYWEKVF
jgi:SAM-dependent methyltransferase